MCKWTRPFWGADCRRSPKSLSWVQAASLCNAGIERARKLLAGRAYCEMLSQYPLSALQEFSGVAKGGQQQFATQPLRVHMLGTAETTTEECEDMRSLDRAENLGYWRSRDLTSPSPFANTSVSDHGQSAKLYAVSVLSRGPFLKKALRQPSPSINEG